MINVSHDAVIEYNREMKEFLSEIWGYVPKGRQKKLVKDERIRSLLERYRIPFEGKE